MPVEMCKLMTLVAAPSGCDRAALSLWALEEAVPSLLARRPDIRRAVVNLVDVDPGSAA